MVRLRPVCSSIAGMPGPRHPCRERGQSVEYLVSKRIGTHIDLVRREVGTAPYNFPSRNTDFQRRRVFTQPPARLRLEPGFVIDRLAINEQPLDGGAP